MPLTFDVYINDKQDVVCDRSAFVLSNMTDSEKNEIETSIDDKVTVDALAYSYTKEEEKKVVRKLDLNLVTYVSSLYLLAFLDRGNIGNAHTAGMAEDLGLSDEQYQWCLTIFYISYIVFEFCVLFWKMFPPRYYAPTMVICWGIVSTCCAGVVNWSGLMALRFFLGLFEAAFGPGVPYYLTFFYYRHEIAWRTGMFMVVAPLASAFAGALAYGITKHEMAIDSWRVLFIVEGLPTVVVGAIGYLCLPNDPKECYFLNEHEKRILVSRMAKQTGTTERSRKLNWKENALAIIDPKNIFPMLMYFGINVSFASLPVFLPTILLGMGYSSVNAQGMTAPPYLFTAIINLLSAWFSDKFMQRGLFITGLASTSAAGFLILALCDVTGVKYFAVFLASGGLFPCVALILSWLSNNQGSESKRGVGFVLLMFVGQCGPVLGTRIFPESEGPYYRKGFFISFAMSALVAGCSICLRFYLMYQNRKLDDRYGKVIDQAANLNSSDQTLPDGSENPYFRYVL